MTQAWKMRLALCGVTIIFTGCNPESGIPVIGVDQAGNPAQVWINDEDYTARLAALLKNVQDSAIPLLSERKAQKSWLVRTLVFGVGVSTEVGIGPFKVGAIPRARLILSNSTEPTLP